MSDFKVTVDAPWTKGEETYTGILALVAHFINQLLYFQKQKDTEYIRRDIQGYRAILESKSTKNADLFFETQHDAMLSGKPFKDNLEIIGHLKVNNLWEYLNE